MLSEEDKRYDTVLSNAIEELDVHFDSVIIIATKKVEAGNRIYFSPKGGFFEIYGAVQTVANLYGNQSLEFRGEE